MRLHQKRELLAGSYSDWWDNSKNKEIKRVFNYTAWRHLKKKKESRIHENFHIKIIKKLCGREFIVINNFSQARKRGKNCEGGKSEKVSNPIQFYEKLLYTTLNYGNKLFFLCPKKKKKSTDEFSSSFLSTFSHSVR